MFNKLGLKKESEKQLFDKEFGLLKTAAVDYKKFIQELQSCSPEEIKNFKQITDGMSGAADYALGLKRSKSVSD